MYIYFLFKLTILKNSLHSHIIRNKVVVCRMMLLFIYMYMCHFKYTIKMKENQQDHISLALYVYARTM